MCRTSNTVHSLNGRTPFERVTGETPDISEYIQFRFYDFVWYKTNAGFDEIELGRWLGVSHRVGPTLSYWILKQNCQVISCITVSRVPNVDRKTPENTERLKAFDIAVKERLNDDANVIVHNVQGEAPHPWDVLPLADDQEYSDELAAAINDPTVRDADDSFTPDTYDDTYLSMELTLPQRNNGEPLTGRVVKRFRDANGIPIGLANENPMMDTRLYEVEFSDGSKQALAANAIADNMIAQIDDDGNRHALIQEIIDHRTTPGVVHKNSSHTSTSSGVLRRRETTKGWELLVEWRGGGSNWIKLKDMKEGYPIETAEYAVANRISDEPAFAWWVPDCFNRRDRIISKVKSKYWLRTHKFGFRIPKSVDEARRIDAENNNTLWWEAIQKEMKNVRPAFEVWEKTEAELPVGYQQIKCHMIFDIKMADGNTCSDDICVCCFA